MNQIYDCPNCDSIHVIPEDEYFDGWCDVCDTDMYAHPEEEVPAPAATGNEDKNEISEEHSIINQHTAGELHLEKRGSSTGIHTATWGGHPIDRENSIILVIDRAVANQSFRTGTPLHICMECVLEHDQAVLSARREREIRAQVEAEVRARLNTEELI